MLELCNYCNALSADDCKEGLEPSRVHTPSADDCKGGLEPSKVYKASINKSLASLAQLEFACVEIATSFQLMTARKDLNLQKCRKSVLTGLPCLPFLCIVL